MKYAPIVISCLAFAFSTFTFYWTALRNKRAFFFIRLNDYLSPEPVQFALINGGKYDLLITNIVCWFTHNDPTSESCPSQTVNFEKNTGMLLSAGKAFNCKISFNQFFTHDFLHEGEKNFAYGNVYSFPMRVEVEWVEMDGTLHTKSVLHSKFGFNDAGEIVRCTPLGAKYNLFEM